MITLTEDMDTKEDERLEEIEGYALMFEDHYGFSPTVAEKAAIDVVDNFLTFSEAYAKYATR